MFDFHTAHVLNKIHDISDIHTQYCAYPPQDRQGYSSSRRSFVMVFGAILAALRKSALLIFRSIRSFHNLLYETAINPTSVQQQYSNYTMFISFCNIPSHIFAKKQQKSKLYSQNRNPGLVNYVMPIFNGKRDYMRVMKKYL